MYDRARLCGYVQFDKYACVTVEGTRLNVVEVEGTNEESSGGKPAL